MNPLVIIPIELWDRVYAFVALDPVDVTLSGSEDVWPDGGWSNGRALASTCRAFRDQGWHRRALRVRASCESLLLWISRFSQDLAWARITLVDSPRGSLDNEAWFRWSSWYLSKAPNLSRLELVLEPDNALGPDGVQCVACLYSSPAPQHLHIQSTGNDIRVEDGILLSELGRAKSIRSLLVWQAATSPPVRWLA